jgi:hypothetical protein
MTKSEVLQFHNGSATESAGERRDDGTHMFKHAENTMAANPKTLEFSVRSEFSVGTGEQRHKSARKWGAWQERDKSVLQGTQN